MQLTPDDHARLEAKQLANIIRKLNSGKTLTAREEAILARSRSGGRSDEVQSVGQAPLQSGFAKSWDELADAVSVDRRTLQNVRDRHGVECPEDRTDGRKEVAAWIRFLDEKGVRGRGVNNTNVTPTEKELRLKEWTLKLRREELKLAKEEDTLLALAEFEAALSQMLGAFRAVLNRLPGRAASKIMSRARAALLRYCKAGLSPTVFIKVSELLDKTPALDFADLEEALIAEVQIVLVTLQPCRFFQPAAAEPAPDEEEPLTPAAVHVQSEVPPPVRDPDPGGAEAGPGPKAVGVARSKRKNPAHRRKPRAG
jgi:hypothetical protein